MVGLLTLAGGAPVAAVARRALNQKLPDRTDGALFFHGQGSTPDWAAEFVETVTLGEHVFYRPNGETGE